MPKLMVTGSERAQVHLALSSCDRQPQYLHDTLLSLFEDDGADVAATLRICVCGTSADYLGAVSESVSKNVQIDTVAEDVWERDYAPADLKRRVSRNFMRVLDGPPGPTIALQDDLSFASGWLSRAVDIADRISAQHGDDFVLALYASYRFKHKPFSPYDPLRFYGNQALWFPDRARRGRLRGPARRPVGPRPRGPDARGTDRRDRRAGCGRGRDRDRGSLRRVSGDRRSGHREGRRGADRSMECATGGRAFRGGRGHRGIDR